ncbi:S8 family serine peptidase [Actinoplanes sp. NPDC051859]|uniref:S8 family serine peptidase n=1 Tax=Actinoplanes sp. NPDC051859 TaxID=3363909 RepID=UPI0037B5A3D7
MRTVKAIRRGGALALAACTVALAAVAPAGPAQADVTKSTSGGWLWQGTTRTVGNVRDDVNFPGLPSNVKPTGKGVGIALIDTGVAPVPGLRTGNVVNGPDLSFDSQNPATRYVDGMGHGTHLAGLISARTAGFTGLAADAKLTSIKVGAANGAVDVSQVIAAIDWATAHRNDDPKNPIKVMVLAYGTDGTQSSIIDPLSAAVENAWRAGITVVVAGGNGGIKAKLLNPATDPFVIAVGALDDNATANWSDDKLAEFSSGGSSSRYPDVISSGRSLVSLRAPGSAIDKLYPEARIGTDYFVGSGSSQAAAVTGAVVADLLQLFPKLTPNQIKAVIRDSSETITASNRVQYRVLDIARAWRAYSWSPERFNVWSTAQRFIPSTGLGTLEGSRGSAHVTDGKVVLKGENDIFGAFSTKKWAVASALQKSWSGGSWMGNDWTSTGYGSGPSGMSSWTGRSWSGRSWSGRSWSGNSWNSVSWQGSSWS